MTNVQMLDAAFRAMETCRDRNGISKWVNHWEEQIHSIMETAPSGSGINNGTILLQDECRDQRLVFRLGYHHMDDGGYYVGWSWHNVVVKPEFNGLNIRVTGKNVRDIKEHLHEMMYNWLTYDILI